MSQPCCGALCLASLASWVAAAIPAEHLGASNPVWRCLASTCPFQSTPACSNLAHLRLAAKWHRVPTVAAGLPLTKLCLYYMAFEGGTLEQRLAGGFSREFTQLAPTLQVGHALNAALSVALYLATPCVHA